MTFLSGTDIETGTTDDLHLKPIAGVDHIGARATLQGVDTSPAVDHLKLAQE
jgi:hypothetical protein